MRHSARLKWRAGVVASIVVVVGAPLLWVWLHASPPDRDLRSRDGTLVGDVTGYLAGLDVDGRQLRVARNTFGLRPFVFVLTDDTAIVVHGKLGGVGDLEHAVSVRVGYQIRDGVRVATSVQVGSAEAPVVLDPPPATDAPVRKAVSRPRPSTAPAPPPAVALPPPSRATGSLELELPPVAPPPAPSPIDAPSAALRPPVPPPESPSAPPTVRVESPTARPADVPADVQAASPPARPDPARRPPGPAQSP
jgi:hypothetical protein